MPFVLQNALCNLDKLAPNDAIVKKQRANIKKL